MTQDLFNEWLDAHGCQDEAGRLPDPPADRQLLRSQHASTLGKDSGGVSALKLYCRPPATESWHNSHHVSAVQEPPSKTNLPQVQQQ